MRKYERLHQLRLFPSFRLVCAALFSTVLLLTGCQPKQNSAIMDDWAYNDGTSYSSSVRSTKKTTDNDNLHIREQWEDRALELVLDTASVAKGTPYVYGGSSLSGFDCSGLVRWAYNSVGVKLPRSAREQSQFGEKVAKNDLRMGDIVAFRHPRRGYHTGIYVGEGKFIHSPRRRDVVKISSLTDAYFRDTYLGARRPSLPDGVDLQAVEDNLASIKAQKKALQTAKNSVHIRNTTKPTTPPKQQTSKNSKKKVESKKTSTKKTDVKKTNKKSQSAASKQQPKKVQQATAAKQSNKKMKAATPKQPVKKAQAAAPKRQEKKTNAAKQTKPTTKASATNIKSKKTN